ncbi:hypothetical protein TNCV_348341 [Trichonephila clavipes]|nr:hypothetical protein TNCV_348341 [Trichonephila clavipes]
MLPKYSKGRPYEKSGNDKKRLQRQPVTQKWSRRNSHLSIENLVLLYTAVMRPILAYASPVWGSAAKTNINMLDTLQNFLIRMIVKATRYMQNDDIHFITNDDFSKEQKRYAAFLSRQASISGESPISFPEDTSIPYKGFEPNPTRLQAECHNQHIGWGGRDHPIILQSADKLQLHHW